MYPFVENLRALLQQGETTQALSMLIQSLQEKGSHPDILRTLRVVEAGLNKGRQDELKGLLTSAEAQILYNKANNAVLEALDDIERGPQPLQKAGLRRIGWIAGIGLAGVVVAAFLYFSGRKGTDSCPEFGDTRPYILILPFANLRASNEVKAAALIKTRIDEIAQKNNFPLSAKVYTAYEGNLESFDRDAALACRQQCGANMVIWGFYESKENADSLRLDTRFLFGADNQTGGTGFRSFAGLPEVTSAQSLRRLDDVVFSLCSWVAYASRRDSLAYKWLNKIKEKAPHDQEMMRRMTTEFSKNQTVR